MWKWKKYTAPKSIYCVFIVYGNTHIQNGLNELFCFLKETFPRDEINILIVNNDHSSPLYFLNNPSVYTIYGDNSLREFSGINKGVQWFVDHKTIPEDSLFIILNETFNRNYGNEYLKLFKNKKLLNNLDSLALIGWKDAYPKSIELFGLNLKCWIRSSFLLLNKKTMLNLFPIILPQNYSEIFSETQFFFTDSEILSENYKSYLKTWLFSEKNPNINFNEHWHSATPLTLNNYEFFKSKTIAILHEHYLSAMAINKEILLVGVNDSF